MTTTSTAATGSNGAMSFRSGTRSTPLPLAARLTRGSPVALRPRLANGCAFVAPQYEHAGLPCNRSLVRVRSGPEADAVPHRTSTGLAVEPPVGAADVSSRRPCSVTPDSLAAGEDSERAPDDSSLDNDGLT